MLKILLRKEIGFAVNIKKYIVFYLVMTGE